MLLRKDIVSLPEQHMLSSVIYLYLNSFFVYLMTVFQKRVVCTKFDIYVFIFRCLGRIVVLLFIVDPFIEMCCIAIKRIFLTVCSSKLY